MDFKMKCRIGFGF